MQHDSRNKARYRGGMDIDALLIDLAWRIVRDWRRRREVDPAIRREWERLYVGIIRRYDGVG